MASSGSNASLSRKRILANVQGRKTNQLPEPTPEEGAEIAAQEQAAERMLSKPVKSKGKITKAKRPKDRSTTQIIILAVIVITGIAAIIGLRYLAEAFGVQWIGD